MYTKRSKKRKKGKTTRTSLCKRQIGSQKASWLHFTRVCLLGGLYKAGQERRYRLDRRYTRVNRHEFRRAPRKREQWRSRWNLARDDDTAVTLHRSSHSICKLPLFPAPLETRILRRFIWYEDSWIVIIGERKWNERDSWIFFSFLLDMKWYRFQIKQKSRLKRIFKKTRSVKVRREEALIYISLKKLSW